MAGRERRGGSKYIREPTQHVKKNSALLGAAFLMATSAIGPGFLTQTARFTAELTTSFGFVILISLLLDIGAQLNIWRVITVSRLRAQDLANRLVPGLGWALAALIAFGGLVFNIGNIAGCGLGLEALTGMDTRYGALVSAALSLLLFWLPNTGAKLDWLVRWLGLAMIAFTIYVAIASKPPVGQALLHTIAPEKIDLLKIITLVGGTVGGYISFAGAHRLLEAGIGGPGSVRSVSGSAVRGIVITTVMRFVLFLAALGVVVQGAAVGQSANPAGAVFQAAAGNLGFRFFGGVMWIAAITSVIGASYTSISFLSTLHPFVERNRKGVITAFILLSTLIFLFLGNPAQLLVLAGAVNGFILPVALAVILIAARNTRLMGPYRHPEWLHVAGWLVVVIMAGMALGNLLGLG